MLDFECPAQVREYVGAALGVEFTSEYGIGCFHNDEMIGGVLIKPLDRFEAELTCYSETPWAFQPSSARMLFGYLFDYCKFTRLGFRVHPRNKKVRRLLSGLGAKEEGKLSNGYMGRSPAILYGMTPKTCRFYDG